jgi:hypothetical protein
MTERANMNLSQQESLNSQLQKLFYDFSREQERAENNNSHFFHLFHPSGQSLALYFQTNYKLRNNLKSYSNLE